MINQTTYMTKAQSACAAIGHVPVPENDVEMMIHLLEVTAQELRTKSLYMKNAAPSAWIVDPSMVAELFDQSAARYEKLARKLEKLMDDVENRDR